MTLLSPLATESSRTNPNFTYHVSLYISHVSLFHKLRRYTWLVRCNCPGVAANPSLLELTLLFEVTESETPHQCIKEEIPSCPKTPLHVLTLA